MEWRVPTSPLPTLTLQTADKPQLTPHYTPLELYNMNAFIFPIYFLEVMNYVTHYEVPDDKDNVRYLGLTKAKIAADAGGTGDCHNDSGLPCLTEVTGLVWFYPVKIYKYIHI